MKINTIMTKDLISVAMDESIARVKNIIEEMDLHHILVVEDFKLVGVISDRDLLKAISPYVDQISATERDLATLNKRAHQIMTRNPVCLLEDSTVVDAIDLFNNHTISCIPVINNEKRPVGIVSWRDIFEIIGSKIKG